MNLSRIAGPVRGQSLLLLGTQPEVFIWGVKFFVANIIGVKILSPKIFGGTNFLTQKIWGMKAKYGNIMGVKVNSRDYGG